MSGEETFGVVAEGRPMDRSEEVLRSLQYETRLEQATIALAAALTAQGWAPQQAARRALKLAADVLTALEAARAEALAELARQEVLDQARKDGLALRQDAAPTTPQPIRHPFSGGMMGGGTR